MAVEGSASLASRELGQGWRSETRYLPLQDDISSVAYWYSDTLDDVYPELPSKDDLEII